MKNKQLHTYLQNIHKQTNEDIVFIMEDDIFSSFQEKLSKEDILNRSDLTILKRPTYLLGVTCKTHTKELVELLACSIDCMITPIKKTGFKDQLIEILDKKRPISSLSLDGKVSSLKPPFVVYLIKSVPFEAQQEVLETLSLFQTGNDCIFLYENDLVFFKEHPEKDFATTLLDFCNAELMLNVDISYSRPFTSMEQFVEAYKDALAAYQICKTFSYSKHLFSLEDALLERIIYALDEADVKRFKQGFHFEEIDEEEKATFEMYVRCNLNLSLTSRNLYIHRNTLIYRLDKLSKKTGIDVQTFQGALTLQLYLYLFARSDS